MVVKVKADVKSSAPHHNSDLNLKPLVCHCNLSARFIPLYRFNTSGFQSQILLGHPPVVMCANCKQPFRWSPPSKPGADDGGWERISLLSDREEIRD